MSYDETLNHIIESNTQEPVVAKNYVAPAKKPLADEIVALVASVNENLLPERKVSLGAAVEVARRSLARTTDSLFFPDWRMFTALREVNDFINASAFGKPFKVSDNSDLLYSGNPLSSITASAEIPSEHLADARAAWIAADKRIAEDYRPIVASAYSAERGSVDEKFNIAVLQSVDNTVVPKDVIISILNK